MSEVEFKLSQLYEAAARISQASAKIDISVNSVITDMDTLMVHGFDAVVSPELVLRYSEQRIKMQKWAYQLGQFADKLDLAATELEQAVADQRANSTPRQYRASRGRGAGRPRRIRTPITPATPAAPPPPPLNLDDYVSEVNKPLLDDMIQKERLLHREERRLELLLLERQQAAEDLTALKNRMLSFDPLRDLNEVPRIQAMENDLARLDVEINTAETNIQTLQTDINDMTLRLERVKPGPGADVNLIAQLEGSETLQIIQENTQDCVRHIVGKLPIPLGIPHNAYLWDDLAAQYTQYGITTGDIPLEGSVLVFEREHAYADNIYGHLMYVESIEGDVIWVTDNDFPDKPVRLDSLIDSPSGEHLKYLYFPWHTRA